jgi:hypothetical protein
MNKSILLMLGIVAILIVAGCITQQDINEGGRTGKIMWRNVFFL